MAKQKGSKGTPVNLSISENIQEIGYRMARADRRTGLTSLVEYLIVQEAKRRGVRGCNEL